VPLILIVAQCVSMYIVTYIETCIYIYSIAAVRDPREDRLYSVMYLYMYR
jgi:hypothetical protein